MKDEYQWDRDEAAERRGQILRWWHRNAHGDFPQRAKDVDLYVESSVPVKEILKGFQKTLERLLARGQTPHSIAVFWSDFLDVECEWYKDPLTAMEKRHLQYQFDASIAEITDAAF